MNAVLLIIYTLIGYVDDKLLEAVRNFNGCKWTQLILNLFWASATSNDFVWAFTLLMKIESVVNI